MILLFKVKLINNRVKTKSIKTITMIALIIYTRNPVLLNQLSFPGSEENERTYWATVEKCNLSVIEPGVNIELEMLSWMNLDLGASYRFVMGSELNTIPNSARKFSGASFQFGLKFTCF